MKNKILFGPVFHTGIFYSQFISHESVEHQIDLIQSTQALTPEEFFHKQAHSYKNNNTCPHNIINHL